MATGNNNPSSVHRDLPERCSVHCSSMGLLSHVGQREAAIPSATLWHVQRCSWGPDGRVHGVGCLVRIQHLVKGECGIVTMCDGMDIQVCRRKNRELMDALGLT